MVGVGWINKSDDQDAGTQIFRLYYNLCFLFAFYEQFHSFYIAMCHLQVITQFILVPGFQGW